MRKGIWEEYKNRPTYDLIVAIQKVGKLVWAEAHTINDFVYKNAMENINYVSIEEAIADFHKIHPSKKPTYQKVKAIIDTKKFKKAFQLIKQLHKLSEEDEDHIESDRFATELLGWKANVSAGNEEYNEEYLDNLISEVKEMLQECKEELT